MSRESVGQGFPHLDLESALLVDFDGLLLSNPPPALLADLATALQLLHGALDGAALVLSGLSAAEVDAALAGRSLPMIASMGWERRWREGGTLSTDAPPPGIAELSERLRELVVTGDGPVVRFIPCGIELDLRGAPERAMEIENRMHELIAATPSFRMLNKAWRYQIVPSKLRKDHAIRLLSDHSRFQRRRLVHVADNLVAEDAARAVRLRGGMTLTVGPDCAHTPDARHWSEVLSWLRRAEVSLSTARSHSDGF